MYIINLTRFKATSHLSLPLSLSPREMVLRSLDNALPVVQERPKKIAKVSADIPTVASVLAAKDENAPPPTKPADPSVEYIASEDLDALQDPSGKINVLMEELDSRDWVRTCDALNDVRRFALHHPDFLLPILSEVMLVIVKAMKNPRSALCKTSIMASSDIFNSFGHRIISDTDELAFDQLLPQLLLKASQDKRFVCEEAEKALRLMASSVLPIPLLQKLRTYVKHANMKIRAKAAVSISCCASRMDSEAMKEFGLAALLQIASQLLTDRLPEAREAARSIAISVYEGFSKDNETKDDAADAEKISVSESWQNFCSSNLSPISAQAIAKITLQL